jgi:glutamyl-tRNA synthetase
LSVRVRYAPSPTGLQHIGSARTALYNYLFARSLGGTFVLRIEDTDRERFVPEALQDIYDSYAWLGISWDEGPDKGGAVGPYFQSERLSLYRAHADELVAKGFAYRCYCTPQRLDGLRKEQQEKKLPIGYDRRCRTLSEAERREAEASSVTPVIRLKVPLEEKSTYTDMLLGEITVDNREVNPDPVMIKSDGFPTYHMANVVDDHLMGITHVMRAQDWLPSTPLHLVIYRAFQWEHPVFCHLPLVMGKDGQKLSKRHGATSVREFRRLGYLPEALVNYLALVGWSYDGSREFFSLPELARVFSADRLNKAPAVFDYQKLDWYNGSWMRRKTPEEFAALITPALTEAGLLTGAAGEEDMVRGIGPLIQERVRLLSEVPQTVRYLFEEPAAPPAEDLVPKKMEPARALEALTRAEEVLVGLTGSDEQDEALFRALAETLGMKLGDLLMPLRVAVTGAKVSPPLFGSIRLLGVERARARAARGIEALRNHVARSH